jgi:hypothetical protein
MPDSERRTVLFLSICLSLVYGAYVINRYEPYTYTRFDPGWTVFTVMSIVDDGDLDLRNQLKNDPSQAADQTSQGKDGEWYPLHEILLPVVTVPFYALFGINGCLIFNLLVSILLMISIYFLCLRHVDRNCAFAATTLTAFATLFLPYTYSYSLDVFSTLLLILAYWSAVSGRLVLSGFVWALAIYSRLPNVVTLAGLVPFLFMAGSSAGRTNAAPSNPLARLGRAAPLLEAFVGALPVGLCFLAMNRFMYGSFLTVSYDRWQHFVNGQAVVGSQRDAFGCSLIDGLRSSLADPKSGILIGAPLLLVAIAFGAAVFWRKAPNEVILTTLLSGGLILLFAKYCYSFPGSPGNRYLMPVVALAAIPLSMAIEIGLGQKRREAAE